VRALALFAVLLVAAPASAQRGVEVVVEGAADDALARRLRSELAAREYAALGREPTVGEDPQALAEAVLAQRVGGYVHVAPTSVEVCARRVRDGALRCERVDRALGDDLVVLQVVEVLRARLLGAVVEAPVEPEPEAPVAIEEPPAPEPAREPAIRAELDVALGTTIPVDGSPPSLDARLAAGLRIERTWALRVWARLPFVSTRVEAPEGAADLVARTIGLEGALALDVGAPWSLELAVAIAGGWLTAIGDATSGVADANVETGYALLAASVAPRVELASGLALLLRVGVGASLPTPVIRFGARDVARFGAPWLTAELGLSATVP
jgi:hypothetical protein